MNKPVQALPLTVELSASDAETLNAVLEGGGFDGPEQAVGAALASLRVRQLFGDEQAEEALNRLLDEDEARGGPLHDGDKAFRDLIAEFGAMAAKGG